MKLLGVLMLIIILLIALWYFGFINQDKIPAPPKQVCIKWDADTSKCIQSGLPNSSEKKKGLFYWE